MKNIFSSTLDHVGFTASALCAIHCALMPFVITLLPLVGLEFLANPLVEILIMVISMVVGFSSLVPSYLKKHRRELPLALLAIGLLLIFGTHLLEYHLLEPILIPLGGILVASAHYFNWRFSKPFHHHNNHE